MAGGNHGSKVTLCVLRWLFATVDCQLFFFRVKIPLEYYLLLSGWPFDLDFNYLMHDQVSSFFDLLTVQICGCIFRFPRL